MKALFEPRVLADVDKVSSSFDLLVCLSANGQVDKTWFRQTIKILLWKVGIQ